MSELFEKSINTLELPQILEMLSKQAVCDETKERCKALKPSVDETEVQRLLDETTAARDMMDLYGSPAISHLKPVAAILQRASLGGSLNNHELLIIANVLRTAREVSNYSGFAEKHTILDPLFKSLYPNISLENKIKGSILSDEEIADTASQTLADIRRHIRLSSGKARDVLQKLISSSSSKYLQDNIITIRNDRFVVPVKSEYKNLVPGLVHDISSSGSTLFIEPMAAVQANNELRELLSREEKEIARILAELSSEVADNKNNTLLNYDLLLQIDLIFARAKLSYEMRGMCPKMENNGGFHFKNAKHPLLNPKTAVPIDLYLGNNFNQSFDTLVVTGPNTGGKTVTLKTAGLLTLMLQCGLHIPVSDDSYFSVFNTVLADIGDEQSIEQSLSTFSSHITNIVKILNEADEHSLILIDELGAGTDPIEGAALAVAIIEEARSIGAKIIATTHYSELKIYAMTTIGVQNASCEFNVETLQPTYRLLIGIPGKSNAFAISRRLGLAEHIIENANKRIDSRNIQFEDVLTKLDEQRQALESETIEAKRLRQKLQTDSEIIAENRQQIEQERSKIVDKAKAEARQIIDDTRNISNRVFNELDDMKKRQKQNQANQAEDDNNQRSSLRRQLNDAENKLGNIVRIEVKGDEPARVGDTVELVRLGSKATVSAVNKDGTLQLSAGVLKITAKQNEVRVIETAASKANKAKASKKSSAIRGVHQVTRTGASRELDIRGMTCDEGIAILSQFLDNAVMSHLTGASIIHGKGTGVLRQAVHDYLKHCKYVKSYRLGRFGEGENGVTIVEFK